MPIGEAQNLEGFWFETEAEFFLEPDVGEDITLADVILEIRNAKGTYLYKTLEVGDGLTVNGILGLQVEFSTDDADLHGRGFYMYQARDPTVADRDVLAWGLFPIK